MPTPVGHALAGLAVAGFSAGPARPRPLHVAVLVFCATAPDLDLVLRLIDGANHHRGPSHSVGLALLVGLSGWLFRRLGVDLPSPWVLSAAWGSHVLLDYLGIDTNPPFGEMALWPLTRDFFISPLPLFYDVPRAFTAEAIRHNLIAVSIEVLVLAPLAWLACSRFLRKVKTP